MTRFSLIMGEEEEDDDDFGPRSSSSSRNPRPKKQPRLLLTRKRRIFCDELDEDEEKEEEDEQPQPQQSSQHHHQEEEEEEVEDEEDDDGEDDEEEEEDEEEYRGGGQTSNGVVKVSDRHSTTTGPKVDGSISVTLTDPDVLDCPICLEPLTIPVFQCENGHVACSCCCSKLRNKCPSCSFPIGYNRCRAIEKVLESVKVLCRYTKYGCKDTVTYSKIHDHEKMCIHSACTCPLPGCVFTSSSECVYRHVRLRHANSTTRFSFNTALVISLEMDEKYLILQEKDEGVIFTLNHDVDRLGSVVNVNCIGPSSSKRGFSYDLIARNGGGSVKSQYSIESVSNWCPSTPRKAFLLVPNGMVGSRRRIELQLIIWKEDRYVLLGN